MIALRGQTSALFFVDMSNEVRSLFVRRDGKSMMNAQFFPLAIKSFELCAYMSCLCAKIGISFDLASSFLVKLLHHTVLNAGHPSTFTRHVFL